MVSGVHNLGQGNRLRWGIIRAAGVAILGAVPAWAGGVALVKVDMAIGPISVKVISEAVDRAFEEGRSLLIVEMDTPGGLDQSMRSICRKLLNADLPVAVYVAPSGARGAAPGGFISN